MSIQKNKVDCDAGHDSGHIERPAFSIVSGELAGAQYLASSNFDDRPAGTEVSLLVVHCISLPPGQFGGDNISQLFCNRLDCSQHSFYTGLRGLQVSAHFLVRRDGEVLQYVNCDKRAWHAGLSNFQGRERCNDFSIGVELEGAEDQPFETVQYEVLAGLANELMCYFPAIAAGNIVGHEDIAPGRKTDPGPYFDWAFFRVLLDKARGGS